MKWLKKCSYLLLVIGMGVIYLNFIDDWQVYAEPLGRLQDWYRSEEEVQQTFHDGALTQREPGQPEAPADAGQEEPAENGAGETKPGEPDGEYPKEPYIGEQNEPDGESQEEPDGEGDSGTVGEEETPGDGFGDGSEPVYMTVEEDYFSDAVFIGDSRTVGLYEYGGLEEVTTFYASKGLTVYKVFDAQIVDVPGQRQKQTIEEALQQRQFKKIYLMIGINEMGTGTVETFVEKYQEVVDHLLELQPEAIIYIQGILKVTTERSEKGDYINNEGIVARNEALSQLADNRRIFYLDVNASICDESGGLEPSYTFDGVHLKAQYIDIWKEYLKSHAVYLNPGPKEQLSLDDSFV